MKESSMKRPGTESQSEDPIKRQKADDDPPFGDDPLFYEGDSDDGGEDDFSRAADAVEGNCWDGGPLYTEEKLEDRRCDKVRICHKDQHKSEFNGLPVFELFKVRVQLNLNLRNTPIHGEIYGEIATFYTTFDPEFDPCNPFPICYYSVERESPHTIDIDADNSFVFLPISGPNPRPPICNGNHLTLDFAFKIGGQDLFNGYSPHENARLFGDGGCNARTLVLLADPDRGDRGGHGPYVARRVVGNIFSDAILMVGYYSVYYGSWATVDVKMAKGGGTGFYGLIVARPCIFTRRIRLLTIEKNDRGVNSGSIKLTRSVVAVPDYASLIIGAKLYVGNDELICCGKTAFPAQESGSKTKRISYNNVEILEVTVRWDCWDEVA